MGEHLVHDVEVHAQVVEDGEVDEGLAVVLAQRVEQDLQVDFPVVAARIARLLADRGS